MWWCLTRVVCGPFRFKSKNKQGDKSNRSDLGGVDRANKAYFPLCALSVWTQRLCYYLHWQIRGGTKLSPHSASATKLNFFFKFVYLRLDVILLSSTNEKSHRATRELPITEISCNRSRWRCERLIIKKSLWSRAGRYIEYTRSIAACSLWDVENDYIVNIQVYVQLARSCF